MAPGVAWWEPPRTQEWSHQWPPAPAPVQGPPAKEARAAGPAAEAREGKKTRFQAAVASLHAQSDASALVFSTTCARSGLPSLLPSAALTVPLEPLSTSDGGILACVSGAAAGTRSSEMFASEKNSWACLDGL